jgi:hypothetical protein
MKPIRRIFYGLLLVVAVELVAWASSFATSGQRTVERTGYNCTENSCNPNGCARCANLEVQVPQGATDLKPHCWTTADNAPGPDTAIHEIPCGADWAWSIFSSPTQSRSPSGGTVVRSTYFNRSDSGNEQSSLPWSTTSEAFRRHVQYPVEPQAAHGVIRCFWKGGLQQP